MIADECQNASRTLIRMNESHDHKNEIPVHGNSGCPCGHLLLLSSSEPFAQPLCLQAFSGSFARYMQ